MGNVKRPWPSHHDVVEASEARSSAPSGSRVSRSAGRWFASAGATRCHLGLCRRGMTFPNVHHSTAAGQRNSRHVCVAHVIPGWATAPSINTIAVGTATVAIEIGSVPEACARTEPSRAQSRVTGTEKPGTCAAGSRYSRHGDRASRRPSILSSISPISCSAGNQEQSAGHVGAQGGQASWVSLAGIMALAKWKRPATVPQTCHFFSGGRGDGHPLGRMRRARRCTRPSRQAQTVASALKFHDLSLSAPVILTREKGHSRISCRVDGKAWPFPAKRDATANKVMQLTQHLARRLAGVAFLGRKITRFWTMRRSWPCDIVREGSFVTDVLS